VAVSKEKKMKKLMIAVSAFAVLSLPSVVMAADNPSAEQCKAWLEKVDVNKDGDIGKSEDAAKYVNMLTKAGHEGMGEDAVVKGPMFTEECLKGTFGMPTG
jgi:hypothetical protein